MRTYVGPTAQDSDRLAADRAWVRGGMAAAVTGSAVWMARAWQGSEDRVAPSRAASKG